MTWNRYRTHTLAFEEAGFSIDVSRVEFPDDFYDDLRPKAAQAFADLKALSLYKSAGMGLRWMSPIGPIRADIAKGLDGGSFRLHISMGPDL